MSLDKKNAFSILALVVLMVGLGVSVNLVKSGPRGKNSEKENSR